jgi:hypothetical protein
MNRRADLIERSRTRSAVAAFASPVGKSPNKRVRFQKNNLQLPQYWFNGDPSNHVEIISKQQKQCTYCKYLMAKAKLENTTPLPDISKPSRECFACGDHLCSLHFKLFHQKED